MSKPDPIPRRPWLLSRQYGMTFILSQDNEIIMGRYNCAKLSDDTLQMIVDAVNAFEPKEPK